MLFSWFGKNETFISMNRDSLFLRLVNRARDSPGTTLFEHSMFSFSLFLESLNEIYANFDVSALQ